MNNKLKSLVKFNKFMGMFHLIQAVFMLIVAVSVEKVIEFTPPVFSNYLTFDKARGVLVNVSDKLFSVPFGILVSSFLFLSAMFHFIISSKEFKNKYMEGLRNNINEFRWYEYSISSSIMIILIGLLMGVNDIGALMLIFGLNASMNLFGLLMEKLNQDNKKINWLPFIYGSVAGILPWIVLFMYAFGNSDPSEVPWFVYAIFGSYFIFFNLFPINMVLQYKKVGKWKDYLYGERAYIILSLVAKSILAWLVFFGVMQP